MLKEAMILLVIQGSLLTIIIFFFVFKKKKRYLILSGIVLFLIVFTFFFFRNPNRIIPQGDDLILSPADGRIIKIEKNIQLTPYPETWTRISIYLSLFDVHVNRVPISSTVQSITYHEGAFFPAFSKNTEKNESNLIHFKDKNEIIIVKQIAGFLARRIVCKIQSGDQLKAGDIFGMIKFGSRVELYLPTDAQVMTSVGKYVKAGETIIGIFDEK